MTNPSAACAVEVLGDPTRRGLLEELARGPRSVGDLAAGLPVTRPAVSQHLAVLEGAGLVSHERRGRRHLYRVDPAGLSALRAWVDALWDSALADFAHATHPDQPAPDPGDPTGPTSATDPGDPTGPTSATGATGATDPTDPDTSPGSPA